MAHKCFYALLPLIVRFVNRVNVNIKFTLYPIASHAVVLGNVEYQF